jgi:hypothetical protein
MERLSAFEKSAYLFFFFVLGLAFGDESDVGRADCDVVGSWAFIRGRIDVDLAVTDASLR